MSKNYINGNKQVQRRQKHKLYKLFITTLIVSIFAIACSSKQNTEDKNTITKTPTPTKETDSSSESKVSPSPSVEPSNVPTTESPIEEPTDQPPAAPTPTPQVTKTPNSGLKNILKDFKPSNEVVHGKVAMAQGEFIFYRKGKFFETDIVVKNTRTSKEETLVTLEDGQLNPSEIYLLDNNLYYQENNDIYRIGVDGENKVQLFKGTASILGMYKDSIIALDKKTKEIIRINSKGEKTILDKVNSINPVEVVVMKDGIYYTNKRVNSTDKGSDPIDRLFFIDFKGTNKIEIDAEIDIYDLKNNGNDLFYLSISNDTEDISIKYIENGSFSIIHTLRKEELEKMQVHWYLANTFTLLGVNDSHIYYGINTDSIDTLAVYSVRTNGKSPELSFNIKDLPGIDPAAYFTRGMMDDGYLKLIMDCDSNPVQIFLINLKDKSSVLLQGEYYNSKTIDVLGDTIYYCKTDIIDPYMDDLINWEYGYSKISSFK